MGKSEFTLPPVFLEYAGFTPPGTGADGNSSGTKGIKPGLPGFWYFFFHL